MKKSSLWWVLLAPLAYWVYLAFSSSMLIDSDAQTYQKLGAFLSQEGWKAYFQTGPHREPLYPLLIAFSLRLSELCALSYEKTQVIIQIGILFLTQLLIYRVLKKLQVPNALAVGTLFYFGISPAIINSTFSLFSEIITYPFILVTVGIAAESWKALLKNRRSQSLGYGALLGINLTVLMFSKDIFELITPIFLLPFIYLFLRSLAFKNKTLVIQTSLFLITIVLIFYPPILAYKHANQTYNGKFTFTNRGAWALYGNTARRMVPANRHQYLTALAYVPGEGVCHSLLGKENCFFWSAISSDNFGHTMLKEWEDVGITPREIDELFIAFTKAEIASNPFQYTFFATLEGVKMFFWESTRIGWVNYPGWLQTIFDIRLFNNGLRFLTAVATMSGLGFLVYWVGRKRRLILEPEKGADTIYLFFLLYFIFAYTVAHSFFFILTRYAFPIVPLYLIAIAYTLKNKFPAIDRRSA